MSQHITPSTQPKTHELSARVSKTLPVVPAPAPPATGAPDQVLSLPGLASLTNVQFAGYAPIGADATGSAEGLFYWFVGADDYANKPTVLWTNGGPGSSSFWGFFLENGPYEIVSAVGQYPQVLPRPTGWNNHANYLIFEHPLSVTLSFASNPADVPKDPKEGARQWHHALRHFLRQHPEIANNPLILAGESYAGTYLPLLAYNILESDHKPKIDLRATVLLDAWVDPMVQMAQDTTYAFTHGLISAAQKQQLDEEYQGEKLAQVNSAIAALSGVYMANTAQTADPCFDPVLLYLNRADVRKALHVGNPTPLTDTWSPAVSDNYTPYVNGSYRSFVQLLLDRGQQVQVISGLNDAKDCNFLGTGAWLDLLTGPAADAFQATAPTQWQDPATNVIGFDQDGGQLSWLKVLNAGHLAVRDQPQLIEIILKKALG
jgi:cathepsin A (carboxypeptidase C)